MTAVKDHKAKYLVVIAGPTGVGKTTLTIRLAKEFNTEILNADSRQVYTELNIGTAKPSEEELAEVSHHFINHVSIKDSFTTADYESQAILKLDELFKTKPIVFLSGGTGLYIQAVLNGLDDIPDVDPDILAQINQEYDAAGLRPLEKELKRVDPTYHAKIDANNPHRIIRALSVFRSHKKPFSSYLTKSNKVRQFSPIQIFLNRDRTELYERINQRISEMMTQGLLEEVKSLEPQKHLNSLKTVGYKELFDYLKGNQSLEDAVELIKRNSRRYAKRQLTWYRNRPDWQHFHPDDFLKITKHIREKLI